MVVAQLMAQSLPIPEDAGFEFNHLQLLFKILKIKKKRMRIAIKKIFYACVMNSG